MGKVSNNVTKGPGRIAVFIAAAGMLGGAIAGMLNLETNFEIEWFLPDGSYTKDYLDLNRQYFTDGATFSVYTDTSMDIWADRAKLTALDANLRAHVLVDSTAVDNWWTAFTVNNVASPDPGFNDPLNTATDKASMLGLLYDWINTPPPAALGSSPDVVSTSSLQMISSGPIQPARIRRHAWPVG